MSSDGGERVNEQRIRAALSRLTQERRPVLVELSGMPRLGKSVFCDSLVDLVREAGLNPG
ncbi:unnamed protein product, partial [marine sediment metagenome]